MASYLVAGAVVAALIAVLVATGQTNMAIVSSFLVALLGPMVIVNHRRAERRRDEPSNGVDRADRSVDP